MTPPLPARPNLEQLRKQAKSLLKGQKAASPHALQRIQTHPRWSALDAAGVARLAFTLGDAQAVVAHEYGFANWPALKTHVETVQTAPSNDADINAFLDAAGAGDLTRLTAILDAHPAILNERGGEGTRTALHRAVFGRREATIRFLLDRGADPNIACDGDSATPLYFACEQNAFPIIRLLVEHGAALNGEDDYHELGVIGWATCFGAGDRAIVDYLIANGAEHTIFSAVAMGEVEAIRALVGRAPALLERRMDLTNKRRRPLHLAVTKNRPESLAALLELGAKTDSLDEGGFTALDEAALSGRDAMAQLLLDHGATVRLPAAVALRRPADLERILRRDPDCLKPGGRWGTLIVRAAERAPGHVIATLIQYGASVDVRDDPRTAIDSTSGYAPLHAAGFFGNLDAATALLASGANVRARDERYEGTPAGWAAFAGHEAVRDRILEGPIDLFEAIEMDRSDRIAGILEREPDARERTFAHYLVSSRATGSFVAGVSRRGWYTPLAYAVDCGRLDAVRVLLAHGADASVTTPEGRTLVELATERGHTDVAQLLSSRPEGGEPGV